jgi:hypothetical protein
MARIKDFMDDAVCSMIVSKVTRGKVQKISYGVRSPSIDYLTAPHGDIFYLGGDRGPILRKELF